MKTNEINAVYEAARNTGIKVDVVSAGINRIEAVIGNKVYASQKLAIAAITTALLKSNKRG